MKSFHCFNVSKRKKRMYGMRYKKKREKNKVLMTIEIQVEFNSKVILSYWCKPWDKTYSQHQQRIKQRIESGRWITREVENEFCRYIILYMYIESVHMQWQKPNINICEWGRSVCVCLFCYDDLVCLCPVLQKTNSQQCYKYVCTCIIRNREAIAQCVIDIHSHIRYSHI